MRAGLVLLAGMIAVGACGSGDFTRECSTSADCLQDGVNGVCLASPSSAAQWCAFDSGGDCTSGLKWGVLAGDGLKDTCVVPGDGGLADAHVGQDAPADAPPGSHLLTVTFTGSGTGRVVSDPPGLDCTSTCSIAFLEGTPVTLTATASMGSAFQGWAGDCSGGACSVTVSADRSVDASFVLEGDAFWVRQFGTMSASMGHAVAVDAAGAVFVAGFDYGTGEVGVILVRKYGADGILVWSREFGNSPGFCLSCGGFDIAVDSGGNPVIVGLIGDIVDFDGTMLDGGGGSSFVAKLDKADGSVVWAIKIATRTASASTANFGIDVDAADNIVVAGGYTGTLSLGPWIRPSAGSTDIFVVKISSDGASFPWAVRFGSTISDEANSLVVDAMNDVVLTGSFAGTVDFGGTSHSSAGGSDAFVLKLDGGAGAVSWVKRYGDTGTDQGLDVQTDALGNVVATGSFEGSVGFGGDVFTSAVTSTNMYVVKLTSTGSYAWSHAPSGTTGSLVGRGVAAYPAGDVVVVGQLAGAGDFGLGTQTGAGLTNAFVARYAGIGGGTIWSRVFSADQSTRADDVLVEASDLLVTGSFSGTATIGGVTLSATAPLDLFVAKLVP